MEKETTTGSPLPKVINVRTVEDYNKLVRFISHWVLVLILIALGVLVWHFPWLPLTAFGLLALGHLLRDPNRRKVFRCTIQKHWTSIESTIQTGVRKAFARCKSFR